MLQNLMRRAISLLNSAPMQYPENSIGYWLDQIKDPEIRAKAFTNAEAHLKSRGLMLVNNPIRCASFQNAMSFAFVWGNTPEGADFWFKYINSYLNSWTS